MLFYRYIKQSVLFQKPFILFIIAIVGLAAVCFGQEENRKNNTEPIRFRRWLAPLDRIDDWPYGPGRYLPLDRKVFEQWTELSKQTSGQINPEEWNGLTRIVLEAKLEGRQLIQGQGCFEIQSGTAKTGNSISFDSLGFWIDRLTLENGTPIPLVREPDDKIHLILPDEKETKTQRVLFHWSLRSRNDTQRDLSFHFSFPPCPAVELLLELPVSAVPVISSGLVMEEPAAEKTLQTPQTPPISIQQTPQTSDIQKQKTPEEKNNIRRWRILPSRNMPILLTVTHDEKLQPARQKTAIQQTIRYNITPQGTDVAAKIFFDKSDVHLSELFLELESPLRVVDVRYGEQAVSWSPLTATKNSPVTRIHIDLSGVAKEEPRELLLEAVCSVRENQPWLLPRVRVVSSNVFWKETRCGVHVQSPFLVRNISCERAVQVTPRNPIERGDWEQFVFQFFEEDSQIMVDFAPHIPRVHLNSGVQVQWGNNEIRGNMIVDCSVADGNCYTLEFPVSPHWTIDSIRSIYWTIDSTKVSGGDEILTWNVIDVQDSRFNHSKSLRENGEPLKILAVQLKHPLRSRKLLRLQLTGRFQSVAQNDFRLSDVSPLSLHYHRDESHYIAVAVQSTIPYHLQYRSPNHSAFEIHYYDSRLSQYFSDLPSGLLFPLNTQTQEIRFGIERLKPNYSAEITGNVLLKEKELVPSFRFRCQPVDSSVDRVYVHLLPGLREKTQDGQNGVWTWSGTSESIQPLQVRLLSEKEQQEILPFLEQQSLTGLSIRGETWEIRPAVPQTAAFEFRAVSSIPLSDSMPVPLASLPLATAQKGEIYIESPKLFQYHIINSRLKSIPTVPTEWYRYQEIRSAFRYDPAEEPRFSLQPPLTIQRLNREETLPFAWIWALRLDTRYESEGIVKNNAIFLLENHGKDSLRIRLPDGMNVGNVHAVWRDDRRISWQPDYENDQDKTDQSIINHVTDQQYSVQDKTPLQNIVVVSLPEGSRFVSVSLEYSHQDTPQNNQRKLKPEYPSVDIPVLSQSWTLWFPPEFEVNLHSPVTLKSSEYHSLPLQKAISPFLTNPRFDPFTSAAWRELFWGKSRYQDAAKASQVFFNWITAELTRKNPVVSGSERSLLNLNTSIPNEPIQTTKNTINWGDVFGNEKRLLEMLGEIRQDNEKGVEVRVILDKQSLMMLGVASSAPVSFPETGLTEQQGTKLFEHTGLVLLVSSKVRTDKIKEYTFYITSFLTNSLNRRFFSGSISNCSRYIPETVDPIRISSGLSGSLEQTGFSHPQWLFLEEWLRDTAPLSMPWSVSPTMIRLASVMPNWTAFEMSGKTDQSFYIVPRGTFAAYYWLAFLTALVLTTRKPFSSPVFLVILLVVFEILMRLAIPSFIDIPGGAFWGTAVSLGFGMIRSQSANGSPAKIKRFPRRTRSTNKSLAEPTNSENLSEPH
ncbi:MAG: hypothetical protein LBU34_15985 [Planctomycetaceae bacterium]|jgi:hypothetical protein|nr:hypothetical protein [Planctomycetaceae bacterium]